MYILWFIFKQEQFIFFTHILYYTKSVIRYFILTMRNLNKTNDQSTQLYFIRIAIHVSDHSIHYQAYTELKFTGKCNYMTLPSQYLWETTSLQKDFLLLLFLALQSLVDLSLFHSCPLLFSVLWLTSLVLYICKSLLMLSCLHCFQLVSSFRRSSKYIFFMGWGCQPHVQPRTWRTRVSCFVWVITLTCLAWEALPVAMLLPA
jgi:hypothetical protein